MLQSIHHFLSLLPGENASHGDVIQVLVTDYKGNLLNSVEVVDLLFPSAWTEAAQLVPALKVLKGGPQQHRSAESKVGAPPTDLSWTEKHYKITVAVLTDAILEASLMEES